MATNIYTTGDKLAIDGGTPVRDRPLPPWPQYTAEEIEIATNVLRSGRVNYWTGDECRNFEQELSSYVGADHGISLANGTLALELALKVLGVGHGDEVIVSPRSYFASASSIVLAGATPVFADVDRDSQNIDADKIEALVTPRTRAIMPVHLAGWPCDMPATSSIARRHGLFVVEDCAQAHGARSAGQPVGSYSDVAAFSFCQDKIMTTAGEGGMLVTDRQNLWEAAWSYKDHGKSWSRVNASDHPHGFRWLHENFGSNWRLTELQAAIGRLQLQKLDRSVNARREHARELVEGLQGIESLRIPIPGEDEYHSYYKFYAFVRSERLKPDWDRDRILRSVEAEGIPGLSGSCPEIYREKAFEDREFSRLPVARELGETSMMLPVHPTLTSLDIADMITAVSRVMRAAQA